MNDLLIGIEAELQRNRLDRKLLIRESFLLWQILVEGVKCSNFSETDIKELFRENFKNYKKLYLNDSDFNFIIGWMMSLTSWFFDDGDETFGNKLLLKAYKSQTKNSLFKWAVRDELNLKPNEIYDLKIAIYSRFDWFYDYGDLIKEYFLDVTSTNF